MARIFLSYRREDSAAHAGRLYDRLGAHFGKANVFMDIDAIELGEDFVDTIDRTVGACDVLIALIGRSWLGATDNAGRRRLDKADDVVRMEIAAALERNIRVIPALVGGGSMPAAAELPESLIRLARRNGLQLSDARFHQDVDRLVESIGRIVSSPSGEDPPASPVSGRPKWKNRSSMVITMLATLALVIAWQVRSYFNEVVFAPPMADGLAPGWDRRLDSPQSGRGPFESQSSSPSDDVETMKVKRIIDANAQYYESALAAADPTMRRVRPNLGILMVPVSSQLANALDLGRPAGAMISEVARGSPAAEAGLRRGDVILLFDRAPIRDVEDFEDKIRAAGPGKHVKLDVWRIRPKGVDSFSTDLTTPPASGTEAQFQQLRRTIDAHNQEAKSIIDSMGR